MAEQLSLRQVLDAAFLSEFAKVHTALPARVDAYYPTKGTVDCTPVVRYPIHKADGSIEYEELPQIVNVPVGFPRGGGFFMSMPLSGLDYVYLVFSEQSFAEWRTTGAISSPRDTRRFGLYPVAYPVIAEDADALESPSDTEMRLGHDTGDARIDFETNIIKLGKGASQFVALANLVQTALDNIRSAYNLHTHPDPVSGFTGTPVTPLSSQGPVAAAVAKAK